MKKLIIIYALLLAYMQVEAQDTKQLIRDYLKVNSPAIDLRELTITNEVKKYEKYDVELVMNTAVTSTEAIYLKSMYGYFDQYENYMNKIGRDGISTLEKINEQTAKVMELEKQLLEMMKRSDKPISLVYFDYVYLNKNVNEVMQGSAKVLISDGEIIYYY